MTNSFDILKELSWDDNLEDISVEKQVKETIFKNSNSNILLDLNIESTFVEEEIVKEKKESKFRMKNSFLFIIKYFATSTAIFFLLLITTNYQAYLNIVNSYINQSQLEQTKNSLINSVEAVNLITISDNDTKKKTEKNIESKDDSNNLNNSFKIYSNVEEEKPSLDIDITPYENRIIIPKIWENIPLLDIKNRTVSWQHELNDIFMQELENWVVRYPWSSKPWEIWNSFIFWHSSNFPWTKWEFNDVFALLDKVTYWDNIIVYYNQKKYIYKITKKNIISPWNISILKSDKNKSELSIMTCRPIWTTLNRLVVSWELVEESN